MESLRPWAAPRRRGAAAGRGVRGGAARGAQALHRARCRAWAGLGGARAAGRRSARGGRAPGSRRAPCTVLGDAAAAGQVRGDRAQVSGLCLSLSRRAALPCSFFGCSLRRLVGPLLPGRQVVTRGFSGAAWADSRVILKPTADMVTGRIDTRTTPGFFRTSLFPASGFSPCRVFPGGGVFQRRVFAQSSGIFPGGAVASSSQPRVKGQGCS